MKNGTLSTAYTMEGGDGPSSYSKNSAFQGKIVDLSKELIRQGIADKLDLESICFSSSSSSPSPQKFIIVDFGCSTGPNTFVSVQNIIEAIELEYPVLHHLLAFQVFFNDHVSNDFNTLFKTMPPSSRSRYFAAGVPGSFQSRLFPESFIHIAHSSYSLHWLSKAPEGITNKGKIFWNDVEKGVAGAYLAQYTNDMDSFLRTRATELVVGGLVMMCFTVRPNGVILNKIGFLYELIGSCLVDMANEGIIFEERVDSFNMPIYHPTVEELKGIIHKNGSFSIEKMEVLDSKDINSLTFDMIASLLKAVLGTSMGKHFGYEVIDELIPRLGDKFKKNKEYWKTIDYTDMFILLKCNK